MDRITFDFEKKTIEIENDKRHGTISAPQLPEKRAAIVRAAGLVEFDAEGMADIIRSMLHSDNS